MKVFVNGVEIIGKKFAYDGCHKIYIIEDEQDEIQATENGYDIYSIIARNSMNYEVCVLENVYNNSCPLRFIHNWKLNKTYVCQYKNACFQMVTAESELNFEQKNYQVANAIKDKYQEIEQNENVSNALDFINETIDYLKSKYNV